MNQTENRIQYGLLTEDEQKEFCVDANRRGMYEYYNNESWAECSHPDKDFFSDSSTYRLKMVHGEIYYCDNTIHLNIYLFECKERINTHLTNHLKCIRIHKNEILYKSEIPGFLIQDEEITTLRPATAEEIEQFNKAFETCPKCGYSIHPDCICEGEYNVVSKPKKDKWTLWQKDCGKKKPKEGTYKDVEFWEYTWMEGDDDPFIDDYPYRFKKVKK